MKNPLSTPENYELFLYTLTEIFPSVRHSTMTFVRRGASLTRVAGELFFDQEIRLIVRERILYDRLPCIIDWYDSQPHPDDQSLQSTQPHHKHIPPDIKRHRIPAPEMSFIRPNLAMLIREIEAVIKKANKRVS